MTASTDYWYSVPEVVPDTALHQYPEVVLDKTAHTTKIEETFASSEARLPELYHPHQGPNNRICGLTSRTFWVVFSIIIVVVVGAVGGGVGGSLAYRARSLSLSITPTSSVSTSSSTSATSTSSLTSNMPVSSITSHVPTTTSSQTTSVTTTEIIGPSTTLHRDCPSSDQSLYDIVLDDGEYTFRKYCSTVLLTNGEDSHVSQVTPDLDSCINRCALYNASLNASQITSGDGICNTVCWWNTLDSQIPGLCTGFKTENSSSGFQFETQLICDSAVWINQP